MIISSIYTPYMYIYFVFVFVYIKKLSVPMLPPQPTDRTHISPQFFTHIPELQQIEQPFPISQIHKQIHNRNIDTQFELIRVITQTKRHKLKLRSNTILENKRNRYPQQSVYEHSRVKLINPNIHSQLPQKNQDSSSNNNNFNDYINANYIYMDTNTNTQKQSNIILTQAPLKQTASDMIDMIVGNRINCVVMLCNVVQNGKSRCYDYLNQINLYHTVQLLHTNLNTQPTTQQSSQPQLQIRRITVKQSPNTPYKHQHQHYQFIHILYTGWPDKSVPSHPSKIVSIVDECVRHRRIVMHCSAGLGRSGVVAVLYRIVCGIGFGQKSNTRGDEKISVFKAVRQLRQDRFGAVQNNQQYRFIYQFMQYYYDNKLSF